MRDGMRRSAGLALLVGLLCAPPARAQEPAARDSSTQDSSAPGPRPWSDPPSKPAEIRRAAEPSTLPNRPAATEPAASASTPVARQAAKPARAVPRPRPAERTIVARRRAGTQAASRPIRKPLVAAAPSRAASLRGPPPMRPARNLPPGMRGSDVDLWIDARADRIRRAQDGGFLVMRRSTLEDPMGRRLQILRPLDDEDE